MYKTFIAGITAISLTLSSAAPAQANGFSEEDIGKLLFGLIATGVVVNLINNRQQPETTAPGPLLSDLLIPHAEPPRVQPPRSGWVQPHDTRDAKVLPRACLKNHKTRYGDIRMFRRDCLRENYRFVSRLPDTCKVRIATFKGPRNGWDPQCLRQAGYTSTRR